MEYILFLVLLIIFVIGVLTSMVGIMILIVSLIKEDKRKHTLNSIKLIGCGIFICVFAYLLAL